MKVVVVAIKQIASILKGRKTKKKKANYQNQMKPILINDIIKKFSSPKVILFTRQKSKTFTGTFTMGSDDPIIPEDGESPAVQQTLTYDYYFDKYEVSNAEFYRFAYQTGYVTEAEKFGDSFCFHLFIPKKTLDEIKLQVQDTPWWLPVQGNFRGVVNFRGIDGIRNKVVILQF